MTGVARPFRPLLLSASLRRIEAAALTQTAPGELMMRAADAVAQVVERHLRARPAGCPVLAFCGPGNNGGDGLLAALLLRQRGFPVHAFELGDTSRTPAPDALRVRAVAAAEGLEPARIESPDALRTLLAQFAPSASGQPGPPAEGRALVIDGLFGIGLSRPLAGLAGLLCRLLAEFRLPVVAIDVPSGIDADTGAPVGGAAGEAIRAVETVTMIADKPGLHTGPALDHCGRVTLASLGLAETVLSAADGMLFDRSAAAALLPARPHDSSKGSFGSVLVVGGAGGMQGAALLAALGAQHSGAGKVWIAAPGAPVFDFGQPQLMTRDPDADFDVADVLVAGCGLSTDARAEALLARVLASLLPAVLDADALNLIARTDAVLGQSSAGPRLLTPHPLEAARLMNCSTGEVQSNRVAAARALANERKATVALKGAGTVVAAPDGRWAIIAAGGPALATAGTGDVLAGLTGGLLAQGLPPYEATLLACWAHGDAADRWTAAQGRGAGLSAAELPLLIRHSLASLAQETASHERPCTNSFA